jgi:HD-GYP domain-containing protein (c-di-GMP phosphodiesterase class II)
MPRQEKELAQSGGVGATMNATRAGYLPVPLEHLPPEALHGLDVFLRATPEPGARGAGVFVPYRDARREFTGADRDSLMAGGIELVYVNMVDQRRLRDQLEAAIVGVANDPKLAISARASILYETGLELVNELLADRDLARFSHRLEGLARATATMVLNDPSAFSHLLTASHHDFYTATHLVNVATFLVPLAAEMGYRAPSDLTTICQAGLLHDIGKLYVPEGVLNKRDALEDEDWWLLQRHPQLGADHLRSYEGVDPLLPRIALEHHERLDGGGYPGGLKGDELDPITRMCSLVDVFDAMTALRPFKKRTFTVAEALEVLKRETPAKFDPRVLEAWIGLLENLPDERRGLVAVPAGGVAAQPSDRRGSLRHTFHCPARLHVLDPETGRPQDSGALQVMAHSISQTGLGVLSQVPVRIDDCVHVYLIARVWNDDYLQARIVRCRYYRDGWYDIGMTFTGRGATAELGAAAELPAGAE